MVALPAYKDFIYINSLILYIFIISNTWRCVLLAAQGGHMVSAKTSMNAVQYPLISALFCVGFLTAYSSSSWYKTTCLSGLQV